MGREKPRALGWGPPRPRVRLALPGQVLKLAIKTEGESFIVLAWAKPKCGGRVGAHKIQRRLKGGRWEDVGTAMSLQHRRRIRRREWSWSFGWSR